MIIRKYLVNNMNEAMVKIKNDLGNEATIISSKKIRLEGIKGFFKKKILEVTAATEGLKHSQVIDNNFTKENNSEETKNEENKIEKEINELKLMIKEQE